MNKKFTKRVFLGCICISLVILQACSSDKVHEVTVVVLDESGSTIDAPVFIAGNHPKLGNWSPDAVPLAYKNGIGSATFSFSQDTVLEFKFTRGNWDTEGVVDAKQVWGNIQLNVTQDTLVRFPIIYWGSRKDVSSVTGNVELIDIEGRGSIQSRRLHIWLPKAYTEDSSIDYPVLYMMDGQNLFDEGQAGFGGEWGLDETMTNGDLDDLIIVGVENSDRRNDEYLDTDVAIAFRAWLADVVVPFVDEKYRTKRESNGRWIGGSSAGGSAALLTVMDYPELFGSALCFSPALHFNGEETQIDLISKFNSVQPEKFHLYMDMGGRGVDSILIEGVYMMNDALVASDWEPETDYLLVINSEDDHNELAWSHRFPHALRWIQRSSDRK